jgi:hypothetical protein
MNVNVTFGEKDKSDTSHMAGVSISPAGPNESLGADVRKMHAGFLEPTGHLRKVAGSAVF